MQLFERLYTTFFTHNAPLVSAGGYYSSEDVFTALPYAKGRRYFNAVALSLKNNLHHLKESFRSRSLFSSVMCHRHTPSSKKDLSSKIFS